MSGRSSGQPTRLRCAIYTRKSSEEGLDQAFNSLHAQREACEAYILSQAGEGWVASKRTYDDGGFSGGSMDRPGLKTLLDDVERGLVDVVVVYKVDRLTRSLADFAKIVETFDAKGVSFVSVTQAFNTTSSMGRLTLNVLLSFAQFEREVTGERIRDKIAASKAKGMWMGGNLPLGYDAKDRRLVINEPEAERVRHIFNRYLELGSVDALRAELEAAGWRSKVWLTRKGDARGGVPYSRGALFHLLRNPTYAGRTPHKDQSYPGLHDAIVDEALFATVQQRLDAQATARSERPTRAAAAPLRGLLFDEAGAPMSPSFGYGRGGRVYRYYVSNRSAASAPSSAAPLQRIAAPALEELITGRLQRLLETADPLKQARRIEVTEGAVLIRIADLAARGGDRLYAHLHPGDQLLPCERERADLMLKVPVRAVFRGGRSWLVAPSGREASARPRLDATLLKALRSAHAWQFKLDASPMTHPRDLENAQAAADSYIRKLTPLAFLAPDIQRAIAEGRQPAGLTLQQMIGGKPPLAWADQRTAFGF